MACVRQVFALFALALAVPALGENWDPRTDPGSGWVTQEWPQAGQNSFGTRAITTPFINGPIPGPVPGNPDAFRHSAVGGDEFMGSLATDYISAALTQFGPQGIGIGFLSGGSGATLGSIGILTSLGNSGSLVVAGSGCGPFVGTPVVYALPDTSSSGKTQFGYAFVMGLSQNPDCPVLNRTLVQFAYTSPSGLGPPSSDASLINYAGYTVNMDRDNVLGQHYAHFQFSPVRDNNVLYYASTNKKTFGTNLGPAAIYATDWTSMHDIWVSPLQTGSGLTTPTPIGQPPPPAAEAFHADTGVAFRGDLVVVGAEKYDSIDYATEGYALMAYNTRDGTQRWIFRTDSRIVDRPVITSQFVIFGTEDGRAYAVSHSTTDSTIDGRLAWATSYANRLTYARYPHGSAQLRADVKLSGPALDGIGQYAYFGGTDGRVHRFTVQSGDHVSSKTILEFAEGGQTGGCSMYYWHDQNGVKQIRPCPISTPPAVFSDKFLVVKCYTQRDLTSFNGAFLCILKLPDLSFNSNSTDFHPNLRVRRNDAVFTRNGNEYGIVELNANGCNLMEYDPVLQTSYVAFTGNGFIASTSPFLTINDLGGVSISDGFVIATDSAGNLIGIPSSQGVTRPSVTIGQPPTGPPAYNPPVVLGPIEVYPNPYNPVTAVGGTLKFRNLPAGSYVELTTLAYERVATLHEINYVAHWDGKNAAGQIVAPGTYLYRIWLPDNKPPVTGRIALTRN